MRSASDTPPQHVLVTGSTGFIGRALVPALLQEGHRVRATTRDLSRAGRAGKVEWVRADLENRADIEAAMAGVDAAYFLVHSMGGGRRDFRASDRRVATAFAAAAARAGVKRIIYLGGVKPSAEPSEHLASRLEVGELLRSGAVPALELRASLIVGNGSASWKIIRDLALRLPAMVLPKWTESRTSPVGFEDVRVALLAGLTVPMQGSAWYDLPGPEVLTGRQMLMKIAALRGRRIPNVRVPFLNPSLSSWWLKLVTGADFSLARELVLGFTGDLLPVDDRYWHLIRHVPSRTFDQAASAALRAERPGEGMAGWVVNLEEALIQRFAARSR